MIGGHGILPELFTRDIVELEAKENLDKEDERELRKTREKLLEQRDAIADLEAFYDKVKNKWGNIGFRNIGHVCVSPNHVSERVFVGKFHIMS